MKRSRQALVMSGTVVALAIAGVVGTASARAASPVVRIRADASLQKTHDSARTDPVFRVETTFSTDTPGADLFTVQRALLLFPDISGTNGRLFPSCSARRIERFHGNLHRCPKGSRIGSGTVRAKALQLGITATGEVNLFNGPHGKSVTFNVRTYLPAYINRSFEAELEQPHGGRYGEKLTLEVPPSLQEILSGVFVGVQEFDVTISGATRVHGVRRTYIKSRVCPDHPLRGVFDFVDGETGQTARVTTDAELHCTVS